ncbi:MAG: hypothetical protein AAF417_21655 [Pseudomonadota bacterium]
MNTERIKAYVELVGIFSILVSLIFVGIELRNSNIQARAAAFQAIGIATAEYHQTMDDRLNLLFDQASDLEALKTWSYADWLAADRRLRADFRLFETALLQVQQGLLDEEALANLGFAAFEENWLGVPGAACLWPRVSQGPGRVGPQVREWIENGSPESERAECPVDLSEKRQLYGGGT